MLTFDWRVFHVIFQVISCGFLNRKICLHTCICILCVAIFITLSHWKDQFTSCFCLAYSFFIIYPNLTRNKEDSYWSRCIPYMCKVLLPFTLRFHPLMTMECGPFFSQTIYATVDLKWENWWYTVDHRSISSFACVLFFLFRTIHYNVMGKGEV